MVLTMSETTCHEPRLRRRSGLPGLWWPTGGDCSSNTGVVVVTNGLWTTARKKTPRKGAAFHFQPRGQRTQTEVTYFETDFLNMRSIFSLVASTPDWAA